MANGKPSKEDISDVMRGLVAKRWRRATVKDRQAVGEMLARARKRKARESARDKGLRGLKRIA